MNARIEQKGFRTTEAMKAWGPATAILLIGLLIYANNYHGEFIFDDFPAIIDNPGVQSFSPLGNLLRPSPNTPLSARPVAAITFALNYAWGGLDVRGYHLVNNLIHILAALALFGLVRATLLLPRFAPVYRTRAEGYGLAVSLIWLAHPLNSEVVNYIVSRTESLVGFFYLLTMFCAATAFRAGKPRKWHVAAVTACGLGMASKEVMVSAPALVLLYDRMFAAGSFAAALRQRLGFYLALAATWLVVGFYQLDNPRADSVLFDSSWISVPDYLRTQLTVIVHYLKLSFWPRPLVLDSQDWPIVKNFSLQLLPSFTIVAALGTVTLAGLWRNSWWSILGVWFFCILAPTSSFIPIVTEIVSERRMYLPLAAIVILVVFTGDHLWRRIAGRLFPEESTGRLVPLVTLIILVATLGAMTFTRNYDYRTAVSIWADNVAKRPGNSRAQENLGKALVSAGRQTESIAPLREAIRLYPMDQPKHELAELYSILGAALSQAGNFQEAISMHRKAIELLPDDGLMHYHLGNAYLRTSDLGKAVESFKRAVTLIPDFPPAYGNLGLVLMQLGDSSGAEQNLRKLLDLAPMEINSYLLYADFLIRHNRPAEAVQIYQAGIDRGVGTDELSGLRNRILSLYPQSADPRI